MKEIVNRLHESRQVEIAKEILESAGYKVTKNKKLKESATPEIPCGEVQASREYLRDLEDQLKSPREYGMEDDTDFLKKAISLVKSNPSAIVYRDFNPMFFDTESIDVVHDGRMYNITKCTITPDEDASEEYGLSGDYSGYMIQFDGVVDFIYPGLRESRNVRGRKTESLRLRDRKE